MHTPDPRCRICGDNTSGPIYFCEACKADPANDGWVEPPVRGGRSRERAVADIGRVLDARASDSGGRRGKRLDDHQADDGTRTGSSAGAALADITVDPTEGAPARETSKVKITVARACDLERRRSFKIPDPVVAGCAHCSPQRVGQVRRELAQDDDALRRAEGAQRHAARRPPKQRESEVDFAALVAAAWLEYRIAGAALSTGEGLGHYGHHAFSLMEIRPPGWFIREELGFDLDHGPSLSWTCAGLTKQNARAIAALVRAGERPRGWWPKTSGPQAIRLTDDSPPAAPREATIDELLAPWRDRGQAPAASHESAETKADPVHRGKASSMLATPSHFSTPTLPSESRNTRSA